MIGRTLMSETTIPSQSSSGLFGPQSMFVELVVQKRQLLFNLERLLKSRAIRLLLFFSRRLFRLAIVGVLPGPPTGIPRVVVGPVAIIVLVVPPLLVIGLFRSLERLIEVVAHRAPH